MCFDRYSFVEIILNWMGKKSWLECNMSKKNYSKILAGQEKNKEKAFLFGATPTINNDLFLIF